MERMSVRTEVGVSSEPTNPINEGKDGIRARIDSLQKAEQKVEVPKLGL